jgi:putative tricarboxylic transport membrane protein
MPSEQSRKGFPRDLAAGLALLGLAAFALWQGAGLSAGSLSSIGPGFAPLGLAVATGICGVALVVVSVVRSGPSLARWSIREPLLFLGAAVAFGLAVRPLGLVVAAPIAIAIGACASRESRWREVLIFGALLTAFCLVLFKFMLGLPVPVMPWLIGY